MAWLAALAGGSSGAAAGAGAAGAGAGAGAAGAGAAGAGAAGATGAGAAGAGASGAAAGGAGAAVGGQSLAAGGAMSAAPPAGASSASMANSALAASATAPAAGGGAAAAAPTSAAAGGSPGVGGGMQGLVGNLLGNKEPGQAGGQAGPVSEASPASSSMYSELEGMFKNMGHKLHDVQKGFLGLSDEDRNALFKQSILGGRSQNMMNEQGIQGGQPLDAATGLPMMAEGGEVAPGGAAVVGEQGPEVVQAQPGGGATVTPHPTGQPQAAGTEAPIRAGAAPSSSGLWPHIGAHIEDALIFVNALRDPGIFLQMRNMKYQRSMALAQMGSKDPKLLESSPAVAEAVDSFLGAGSSAQLSPTGHNTRLGDSFNIKTVPEGTPLPDGTTAPAVAGQVMRGLGNQGIGAKIDDKGYVIPNIAAGSFADRAAAYGWSRMVETRDALVKNGQEWGSANVIAANQALREMSAQNMPPPRELVGLALGDLTAEQAQEGRNRSNLRATFGLSRERAGGAKVGAAAGEELVAGASPTAEGGQEQNVYLGKLAKDDPRIADLAKRGYTLETTKSGYSIAIPPTAAQPGTSLEAAVAKPENIRAFNAATDIVRRLASKDVADIFPDEGQNPGLVRGSAQFSSWVAQYTDPAKAEAARQLADSLKLQLDRLETGGVPRSQIAINAVEGLLGGIRDRSISKQQYQERMKNVTMLLGNYDPTAPREVKGTPSPEEIESLMRGDPTPDEKAFMDRIRKGDFRPATRQPAAAPAAPAKAESFRRVGGTLRRMETELQGMIDSGKITKAQALRKLRAAEAAGLPEN